MSDAKPKRIQRKRTKGWTAPDGAVYVGRPSYYGNPFSVPLCGRERSVEAFRALLAGVFDPYQFRDLTDAQFREVYHSVAEWQKHHVAFSVTALRGKDLMCWCPLDQPCHADVLLEIANAE